MESLLHQFSDLSERLLLSSTLITSSSSSSSSSSEDMTYLDPNNNNNNSIDDYDVTTPSAIPTIIKSDKYSLRPRSLRRTTTDQQSSIRVKDVDTKSSSRKPHKPKQKPAPLSKYRRKTANARERNRMREINQAFETLRRVIPHMPTAPPVAGANEKLTKITTLRLAMKYIASLSATLNGPASALSTLISDDYSDLDCFLLESDGESLPLSDHSLLDASPDFPEPSLSPVDFGDPCLPAALLHTDFTEHDLEPADFSDFLLT